MAGSERRSTARQSVSKLTEFVCSSSTRPQSASSKRCSAARHRQPVEVRWLGNWRESFERSIRPPTTSTTKDYHYHSQNHYHHLIPTTTTRLRRQFTAITAAAIMVPPKLRFLSAWFCPYAHRATIALEHHAGRIEYEWVEVRACDRV